MHASPRFLLILMCIWRFPGVSIAGEESSEPETLVAALNGDGQWETISWRRLGGDSEIGTFFQLVVKEASGVVLWKSPEVLDPNDRLAFGEWHFGISLPQLMADVDRDGKVKLIVPAPQSDVSPTFFRVFEWMEGGFQPKFSRALTGPGLKGGSFEWTESPSLSSHWVQQWMGQSAERGWVVKVVSMPEGRPLTTALAVIVPKDRKFELVRWIEAPSPVSSEVEAPSPAQEGAAYRARLSAEDHRNSAGAVLNKIPDILRQDRANFHRGTHQDAEDESDSRFGSPESRGALGAMKIIVSGGAKAEVRIIRGTPVVEARIVGNVVHVRILED